MKNTLMCLVQDRLGALDRVLGALTHRGLVPEAFSASRDETSDCLQVTVRFECEEEKSVEKLLKFLNNQVYVLETRLLAEETLAPVMATVPATVSPLPLYAGSRLAARAAHAERR
jgi:acetolactate synthase small subunit